MNLGIIIGQVVATRKDEKLTGSKLMITQPVDAYLHPAGEKIVAVDTVGAGVGETVLYVQGYAATRAFSDRDMPVDAAIIGIVDKIDCYEARKDG
ncbi:MAG: EutN/CcmL family microcompartment protein [Oscillospiraceae bacterium]|nr:EutN/CcmL family microcompartment protein [Oscillospiraceae bacterium]MDD3260793.1 EutN/CcmL family microcompartment protein [Oscillospiraceae bacterium]